ncbi:odorant receptor 63a-like [Hermetia illucens]|uniref:odorant receptor 63a-like n=1 Tax=Hermetia illucens TaxID=343691 RepID=UPI0018CC4D5A|nr:odorant receptor 63a-like [Hermetia illucens]
MLYEDLEKIRKKNLDRMKIVRRITYTCGINISEPSFFKKFIVIHAFVVIFMSLLSIYGHIAYISEHFTSVFMISQSLCTCLQTLISIIKLFLWVFMERRFYKLVKATVDCELFNEVKMLDINVTITKTLREKTKKIIEDCWKRAQFQIRYYVVSCIAIISFYFLNALAINTYHSIKGNTNHTKLFAFSTYYPGWEEARQHFPLYPFFTILDGYADFAAGMVAATFDGYYVFLTFHAVALFKTLKEMIIFSSTNRVPKGEKMLYIRECVYHYNRCIRFCDEINDMYAIVNLSQLLISLVVLGVVLFQASIGLENDPKMFVNMVLYISAAGYELVIYCFDGQNITSETENICDAWYSSNWYDESREFKSIIYMMMMRTRKPYHISALGFTTMSRPTFLGIAKTSGSYFMLLRNVA